MFRGSAALFALFFFLFAAPALVVNAAAVEEKRNFIDDFTSAVGNGFDDIKTIVQSIEGKAETVITAAGGQALTLANDGKGVVTSIGHEVYTIATAELNQPTGTHNPNSAPGMHALSVSTSLLGGLLTVFVATFMGAWIVL